MSRPLCWGDAETAKDVRRQAPMARGVPARGHFTHARLPPEGRGTARS